MKVRSINPEDDFAAIGNIYARSWQHAYRGIVNQSYLDDLQGELWVPLLKSKALTSFLLTDGPDYLGTASVCPARDERMAGWGELVSLYLLPEYFGKGLAVPLFDCALNALIQQGYRQIYLWVLEDNLRARSFYEKQGFRPNGDFTLVDVAGDELRELRYVIDLSTKP